MSSLLQPLVRPVARMTNWAALLSSGALGFAAIWLARRNRYGEEAMVIQALRMAAVALAFGLALQLDDDTEELAAAQPVTRMTLRCLRALLAAPLVLVLWAFELEFADGIHYLSSPIDRGVLSQELAALCAASLGAAAVASNYTGSKKGGAVGVATLFALCIGMMVWPPPSPLLRMYPDAQGWPSGHAWWSALLIVGVVAFLWGSADPGRTRLAARFRFRLRTTPATGSGAPP